MPRPDTPRLSGVVNAKSLPWQPKVRQKDLENFLDQSRQKFVGYSVQGDQETMAGLPNPIHEGVVLAVALGFISGGVVNCKY